jgi:hypothetical protein
MLALAPAAANDKVEIAGGIFLREISGAIFVSFF